MMRTRATAIAATILASASLAKADLTEWTPGAANPLWTDPVNWSNGVPGPTDLARLASPPVPILLGADRSVGILQVTGTAELVGGSIVTDVIENGGGQIGNALLKASIRAKGSELSVFGFSIFAPGLAPGLSIDGPIVVEGVLEAGGLVNLLGPVSTGMLRAKGRVNLAGAGTLKNASQLDLVASTLQIDNSESPLSSRLNPEANLRNTSALPGLFTISGHTTEAVNERLRSVVVDRGTLSIAMDDSGAAVRLDVSNVSIGAKNILGVYADGVTRRFTTDVAPPQIGGSGSADRGLVRNAMALATASSNFDSAGPMTYDTALAADGRHVGLRPLRNDEFASGFASASASTNVRVGSTVELSSSTTVNSLTVDRSSRLTLAGDLNLSSGILWHSAAGDSADAPSISGPGKLTSVLPLQIFASRATATDAPVLNIDSPIDSPSLLIAGNGIVRLSGNNLLPDGVKLEAGGQLTVAQPQALGTGTFTQGRGRLRFEGSQTISNPIHYEQVDVSSTGVHASSFGITIDPGHVVTLDGPLSGGGILYPIGGMLRLNGGGSFSGVIGSSVNSPIEINGNYTTVTPSRTLVGTGAIYGNATVPLQFRSGRISPGAINDVGQLHICSLDPDFGQGTKAVLISLAGSTADRLILDQNSTPLLLFPFSQPFSLEVQVLSSLRLGQTHTIIEILNPDAPRLTLANVSEGTTLTASGYLFRLSLQAGDGNDVTLTVLPEPASLAAMGLVGVIARRARRRG